MLVGHNNLASGVRRGLAWSSINTLVLKMGTFAIGIALARLLAPEQFGVFAVALTVQVVLMSLADLGMTADLVRTDDPARLAPTVSTLALITGAVLTTTLVLSAHGLASLLGSPEAGPVIAVMAFSLLLAGAGVVPYAALQRRFAQKQLFLIALADFMVSSILTVVLVTAGFGVIALAIGRLAAQLVTLILQFVLSGERVRLGFNRKVAPEVLAFGLPVAGANVLSWALLNVDNVAISRLAGPIALGFYFLAFNISNWPMSALGQVVRSISLPTFSRLDSRSAGLGLTAVVGPVWALSLLAGLMIATLSSPIVELVYGRTWLPAAPILGLLGIFGAFRVVFDLTASFLLSRGAAKATLIVQVAWMGALTPAMFIGAQIGGSVGAAAAHLLVALLIVVPAYGVAIRGSSASVRAVASQLWPPIAAASVAAGGVVGITTVVTSPFPALLLGTLIGAGIYVLLLRNWFIRRLRTLFSLFGQTMPLNRPMQTTQPPIEVEQ